MPAGSLARALSRIRKIAAAPGSGSLPDQALLERFLTQSDEAAFADLVRRHGPMVLGVCRSVLRHEQDAEDAFQAAFLILAQRAGSIRDLRSVGSWLYEVAYRVALRGRATARRHRHDRGVEDMPGADSVLEMSLRELRQVVYEELERLPEKFRAPLILCYLEGKTHEEAAGQLGWTKGAVRGRLNRGRELLRGRLDRRGLALPAGLLATALASLPLSAAVPVTLVHSTAKPAAAVAAGNVQTVSSVSPKVAALVNGVTNAMFLTKLKTATAVLLLAAAAAAGFLAFSHDTLAQRAGDPPAPPDHLLASGLYPPAGGEKPPAPPAGADDPAPAPADDKADDALVVSGRVVGPDGKPRAGAALYDTTGPAVRARSDAEGRFRFIVPRSKATPELTVVAQADDHGPAWAKIPDGGELTLRLVKDDVPVTGRVLDLQGKPVAGVTVRVARLRASPDGDLAAFVAALKAKTGSGGLAEYERLQNELHLDADTPWLKSVAKTDDQGRFRLEGLGRERLVVAVVEGPAVATRTVRILTRPGAPLQAPRRVPDDGSVVTYAGPDGDHAVVPHRPVTGVVRDRATRKPIAGVRVEAVALANTTTEHGLTVGTVTDDDGRFRLAGLPKGKGNRILAVPGNDLPYLQRAQEVADPPGLDPVEVAIELTRGVWVSGRVTDKATGKPVPAAVDYYVSGDNPSRDDVALDRPVAAKADGDGSFRVAALPGPGFIAVRGAGAYLAAHELDKHPADDPKVRRTDTPVVIVAQPQQIFMPSYHCVVQIDAPAEGREQNVDVALERGETVSGVVVGPDGKPLPGALACGLTSRPQWAQTPLTGPEFTLRAFNPQRPRVVLFQHPEKKLAGKAQIPEKATEPFKVQLQPAGTITGRVVDADGQPLPGLQLLTYWRNEPWTIWVPSSPEAVRTDAGGRFRIECAVPGLTYELASQGGRAAGLSVAKPGETKDVGDVKLVR